MSIACNFVCFMELKQSINQMHEHWPTFDALDFLFSFSNNVCIALSFWPYMHNIFIFISYFQPSNLSKIHHTMATPVMLTLICIACFNS